MIRSVLAARTGADDNGAINGDGLSAVFALVVVLAGVALDASLSNCVSAARGDEATSPREEGSVLAVGE